MGESKTNWYLALWATGNNGWNYFSSTSKQCFRMVSEDDSGRLLANIYIKNLPEKFWKNVYNIGGGESFRKTNYEFLSTVLAAAGIKDIEKIFEPSWFATRNFHGQYYLDSDRLNEYLDFRKESMEDFILRMDKI